MCYCVERYTGYSGCGGNWNFREVATAILALICDNRVGWSVCESQGAEEDIETESQGNGENCTLRRFTMCIPHQILHGRLIRVEWDGRGM